MSRTIEAIAVALFLSPFALSAQDSQISVPTSVLQEIGSILPERSSAGSAFLSDSYSPNLNVTKACSVEIVFIWEGAGYQNSLGWFRYRELSSGGYEVLEADLVIRNASFPSAGSAQSGHVYKLKSALGAEKVFQAGDKVGFFLIADGNRRSSEVANWQHSMPGVPSTNPEQNRRIGRGLYTTLSRLNPEFARAAPDKARHLAMIWMPGTVGFLDGERYLLCGFEDLDRSRNSDEDFNDLVFIVRSNPIDAIDNTQAFQFRGGDPDGDGVYGIADHFPSDATRAQSTRFPNTGWNALAFEDSYPSVGDADYNDVVIAYSFERVVDAAGKLKDLIGTFHLTARGAAYDHAFGVHLEGIPGDALGTLRIERRVGGANPVMEALEQRSVSDLIYIDKRRVREIFDSTKRILPPPNGETFSNTRFDPTTSNAGGARFHITFDTAIDASSMRVAPYDPYLAIKRYGDGIWDVHLPGHAGFADRASHLPPVSNPPFYDANKFPWVLEVPPAWRFPMERREISYAYPGFNAWRESFGAASKAWYDSPISNDGRVGRPLDELIPSFTWRIGVETLR